jgi:hypothetical protein
MVGEKLGSFKLESILGSGAMGVVYKATHESKGIVAAVKIIHNEVGQKGKVQERFDLEGEILRQFRHPNIVRWYANGRYRGTSYFAMEYVQGKTFDQMLMERGPLPWKEVADLGRQVCDALQYAHDHGVVHRDLKPSNLMVTENGQVKLTDFGIAKDLDGDALTATGRTLGTAAYMAPEQIRGTPAVSHKTDLYALGILLYQMLTGRLPYEGSSPVILMNAHINAVIPRPSSKIVEIPRALDDLVVQLMAKEPPDRPWDATAVGDVLKTVAEKASRGETIRMVWPAGDASGDTVPSGRTMGDDEPRPKKRTRKSRSGSSSTATLDRSEQTRRRLEVAGMALALVLIGGFIGYWLYPPSASYLHAQADRLMASKDRHNWKDAIDEYVEPLDRRFPDHPYKQQTQAWRDQLLLYDTESRADTLASPVKTKLSNPHTDNERRFVEFHTRAAAAEAVKDEPAAVVIWDELARQCHADDTELRGWYLLARKRSEELKKVMADRQALVRKLLEEVLKDELEGRTAEAQALRQRVLAEYGPYRDVSDLLGLRQAATPPPDSPRQGPAPPASPPRDPLPEAPPSAAPPGESPSQSGTPSGS